MTDDETRPPATAQGDDATPQATAQDDAGQTAKDRSYSPASGRETEALQREPLLGDDEGAGQRPGTGGPDDPGDLGVPDDEIDASVIRERSDP